MPLLRSFVLALALGSTACAEKVNSEIAGGYDVRTFDSYAWVTEEPVLIQLGETQTNVRTPENERRIRAAIDEALTARGLTKLPFAEADVHVAFSVGTVARYRLEGGRDSWIAGLEPGQPQTKGTLHVYLLHPGDEREVWHAWTSKWLSKEDDPEAVIRGAVARIMTTWPGGK